MLNYGTILLGSLKGDKCMIDYRKLADYIIITCNKENKDISNLKLQKLIFYCQAYHIARYRERLIDNYFEAWKHGAVLPALYSQYSYLKYKNINKYDEDEYNDIRNSFDEYLPEFLDKIINKFGNMTANEIRELNHSEKPWQEARKGYKAHERCNEIISEKTMYEYYSNLLYEEGINNMEVKKINKASLKDKKLLLAKKRLEERALFEVNEDNKKEYFEVVYNDLTAGREYTWRAMDGK